MDRILGRIKEFLFPCLYVMPSCPPYPSVRHFKLKEIKSATANFSTFMGSDCYGAIYRAQFSSGLIAAVREVRNFGPENDAFYKQVQILGRLHHRHIVTLRGFSEGCDRFLIFDFVGNGSLKELLRDPLKTPLNWKTRLRIATDVAAALEYLQYFCNPPILYDFVDSSNVMLDENFAAKLSGMGALGSAGRHFCTSEFACSSETDQKRKHIMFQFGVLILELITGQYLGNGEMEVVEWVQGSGFTNSMHNMVDADLGYSYDSNELKSLLIIARLCTKNDGEPMISVPQVLRYLQRRIEASISHV
ncbi:probable receptor-like protein kinase At1g49730 [Aristolochia californica]|uniref:probable receptor-like protein kinase At1g49730 n=1 Tax=Aristolochia californica TaxID=171875 RepID=UPI0035D9DBCA